MRSAARRGNLDQEGREKSRPLLFRRQGHSIKAVSYSQSDLYADDAMIEIGRLVSRPEALTVKALLDAAGIDCHIGGLWHGMAEGMRLGLAGLRLTVPICQYEVASAVLREAITESPSFNFAERRSVLKLLLLVMALHILPYLYLLSLEEEDANYRLFAVVDILVDLPASAQGRGSWYLADAPAD